MCAAALSPLSWQGDFCNRMNKPNFFFFRERESNNRISSRMKKRRKKEEQPDDVVWREKDMPLVKKKNVTKTKERLFKVSCIKDRRREKRIGVLGVPTRVRSSGSFSILPTSQPHDSKRGMRAAKYIAIREIYFCFIINILSEGG